MSMDQLSIFDIPDDFHTLESAEVCTCTTDATEHEPQPADVFHRVAYFVQTKSGTAGFEKWGDIYGSTDLDEAVAVAEDHHAEDQKPWRVVRKQITVTKKWENPDGPHTT